MADFISTNCFCNIHDDFFDDLDYDDPVAIDYHDDGDDDDCYYISFGIHPHYSDDISFNLYQNDDFDDDVEDEEDKGCCCYCECVVTVVGYHS